MYIASLNCILNALCNSFYLINDIIKKETTHKTLNTIYRLHYEKSIRNQGVGNVLSEYCSLQCTHLLT